MKQSLIEYSFNRDSQKKSNLNNTHNINEIVYNIYWFRGPYKITSDLQKVIVSANSTENKFEALDMTSDQIRLIPEDYLLSKNEILDWYTNVWPRDHPGYDAQTKKKITDNNKILKTDDIVYVSVSEEAQGLNILRKAKVVDELGGLVNDDKTYTLIILDGPKKGNQVTQGVTNLYQ